MYPVNDQFPEPPVEPSVSRAGVSASLTYEPFYRLREKPFSLSADPRFLFRSPAHGPAFDELLAGIRRREGLIVLTGEIGTGKTTLCRSVLQHLDRRTFAAFVADPFVSREDLLKTLLVHFGVISMGELARGRFNGASRSDLSYPLYEFLDSLVPLQAFAVVVIDEAQNLSLPLLEEIRVLSELERREKLLQVVLVGQPELRANLRLAEMRQVDQRVSVCCELTPLDAAGVAGYVRHRLDIAGRGESGVEFTPPALEAIYESSSGVPRLINRICDRALQRAFASRAMQVDAECVRTAIDDLGLGTAIKVQRPVSHPTHATAIAGSPVADAPVRPQAAMPSTQVSAPSEPGRSGLLAFDAEAGAPRPQGKPIRPSGSRHRWMTGAAAAVLVIAASIGAPVWYMRAQTVDGPELAAMLPPHPAKPFLPPAMVPPPVDPIALASWQADGLVPVSAGVSVVTTTAPQRHGGYSILVAAFQNPDRAERLVEELVNAGYGAHMVERSGGPTGRLVQVTISGYTSAIDVERDLQRIRELPGRYGDARIVEQN